IERAADRLRLTLPLGTWSALAPAAQTAMRALAGEANACSRLVRIAWQAEGNACRCTAQVDLTGLPVPGASDPARRRLWRDMLRLGMAGLDLALRRLALELGVLAETQNGALVELFHEVNRGPEP